MIGVEQGASEQPTEDCDGGREGDATAGVALAVAERMTATHPNRSGTDSFSRSLRRYLKKNPGADPEAIAGAHERWLASGVWDEEGGRYAPQLARWLWGGDWKQEPPERPEKKPPRPVEDASVFHAGASL